LSGTFEFPFHPLLRPRLPLFRSGSLFPSRSYMPDSFPSFFIQHSSVNFPSCPVPRLIFIIFRCCGLCNRRPTSSPCLSPCDCIFSFAVRTFSHGEVDSFFVGNFYRMVSSLLSFPESGLVEQSFTSFFKSPPGTISNCKPPCSTFFLFVFAICYLTFFEFFF